MRADELLTTGEAAAILGCSRQHVTDLCRTGALPYRSVGTHRRIVRADLERLAGGVATKQRDVVRERLRSLWLHRAVAGRLAADPEAVLATARSNLQRARVLHPRSRPLVDAWERILADPEEAMARLTALDDHAAELRHATPFAGVLDQDERDQILEAFAEWWRRTHAT